MVQEEAIASWIEAMDEKKDKLKSLTTQVETLEAENEQVSQKMNKIKGDYDNVVKENMRLTEENRVQSLNLDAKSKELNQELKVNKELLEKVKELEAKLGQADQSEEIEQMKAKIEVLTQQKAQAERQWQEESTRAQKQAREELAAKQSIRKERDLIQAQFDELQNEFKNFKDLQAIKDLLVVKFDINDIDEDMLTAKETKIETLEKYKTDLEKKIQNALQDYNIKLSNEKSLNEKVQKFQTKVEDLSKLIKKTEEESQEEIKRLARENALLLTKNDSLEKTLEELKKQHEDLI